MVMDSEYTKGFEAGKAYAYAWVVELIFHHLDAGVNLTMEEILREVEWVADEKLRLEQKASIARVLGDAKA
jgi:hypothetical protein